MLQNSRCIKKLKTPCCWWTCFLHSKSQSVCL